MSVIKFEVLNKFFNRFLANVSIFYPVKTENQRFSSVFGGFKMGNIGMK